MQGVSGSNPLRSTLLKIRKSFPRPWLVFHAAAFPFPDGKGALRCRFVGFEAGELAGREEVHCRGEVEAGEVVANGGEAERAKCQPWLARNWRSSRCVCCLSCCKDCILCRFQLGISEDGWLSERSIEESFPDNLQGDEGSSESDLFFSRLAGSRIKDTFREVEPELGLVFISDLWML